MTSLTPHPRKLLLFALLSVADLALTWWLLTHSDGVAYEANAVANWWLARFGWLGLACYKASAVLVVAGLCAAIAQRRPVAAGRVLLVGCAVSGAVVAYSAALGSRVVWGGPAAREALAAQQVAAHQRQMNGQTREKLGKNEAYEALRDELRDDLVAGRCSLEDAAARLARTELVNDPDWRRGVLRIEGDRPGDQLVATLLIRSAVLALDAQPARAWRLALRLEREFEAAFGTSCPRGHRALLAGRPPAGADAVGSAL
jgi:hypothetical protein